MTDAAFLELLAVCEQLAESHGEALRAVQTLTSASLEGRGHHDAALLAYQEQAEKAATNLERFPDARSAVQNLIGVH